MPELTGYTSVRKIAYSGNRRLVEASKNGAGNFELAMPPAASDERRSADDAAFLESMRLQEELAAGSRRWVRVLEIGTWEGRPAAVTERPARTAQWLIDRAIRLNPRQIHHLLDEVLLALRQLHAAKSRGHGSIKPADVVLKGHIGLAMAKVQLRFPAGVSELPENSRQADLRAVGELLLRLVSPMEKRGDLPRLLEQLPQRFGKRGAQWKSFADSLLRAQGEESSVEVALQQLRRLRPLGRWVSVAVVLIVLCAGSAAALRYWRPPPPPPPDAVWNSIVINDAWLHRLATDAERSDPKSLLTDVRNNFKEIGEYDARCLIDGLGLDSLRTRDELRALKPRTIPLIVKDAWEEELPPTAAKAKYWRMKLLMLLDQAGRKLEVRKTDLEPGFGNLCAKLRLKEDAETLQLPLKAAKWEYEHAKELQGKTPPVPPADMNVDPQRLVDAMKRYSEKDVESLGQLAASLKSLAPLPSVVRAPLVDAVAEHLAQSEPQPVSKMAELLQSLARDLPRLKDLSGQGEEKSLTAPIKPADAPAIERRVQDMLGFRTIALPDPRTTVGMEEIAKARTMIASPELVGCDTKPVSKIIGDWEKRLADIASQAWIERNRKAIEEACSGISVKDAAFTGALETALVAGQAQWDKYVAANKQFAPASAALSAKWSEVSVKLAPSTLPPAQRLAARAALDEFRTLLESLQTDKRFAGAGNEPWAAVLREECFKRVAASLSWSVDKVKENQSAASDVADRAAAAFDLVTRAMARLADLELPDCHDDPAGTKTVAKLQADLAAQKIGSPETLLQPVADMVSSIHQVRTAKSRAQAIVEGQRKGGPWLMAAAECLNSLDLGQMKDEPALFAALDKAALARSQGRQQTMRAELQALKAEVWRAYFRKALQAEAGLVDGQLSKVIDARGDFGVDVTKLEGEYAFDYWLWQRRQKAETLRNRDDVARDRDSMMAELKDLVSAPARRFSDAQKKEIAGFQEQLRTCLDSVNASASRKGPATAAVGTWTPPKAGESTGTYSVGDFSLRFVRVTAVEAGSKPFYMSTAEVPLGLYRSVYEKLGTEQQKIVSPIKGAPIGLNEYLHVWININRFEPAGYWMEPHEDVRLDKNNGDKPFVPADKGMYQGKMQPPPHPTDHHPMQMLDARAATGFARLAGCELPTVAQYEAALKSQNVDVRQPAATRLDANALKGFNLQDETWKAAADIIMNFGGRANSGYDEWNPPVAPMKSDGTVFFAEVEDGGVPAAQAASPKKPEEAIHHLIGNVAEFARETSAKNAPFVVYGASALSNPPQTVADLTWTSPDAKLAPATTAFCDVGFRLCFEADSPGEQLWQTITNRDYLRDPPNGIAP